jgi:hypothetical protein
MAFWDGNYPQIYHFRFDGVIIKRKIKTHFDAIVMQSL